MQETEYGKLVFALPDGTPVVRLRSEDGIALEVLIARCAEYHLASFGLPPGDADAQSQFYSGLELVPEERKYLVGCFSQDHTLLLGADFLEDYPSSGAYVLGLLLVDPSHRSRGLGEAFVRTMAAWASSRGGARLRIDCQFAENQSTMRFWKKFGASEDERRVERVGTIPTTRVVLSAPLPLSASSKP